MNDVTILTPTYNRAHTLPGLYGSLLRQTSPGFSWLIVDDGSGDDTAALVKGWQDEGKLDIRYVLRENGGKHRALNTGLPLVETPLTFIVDSDDTLSPDAIEQVERLHRKYGTRRDLCGYSFFRRMGDGYATAPLKREEQIGTFAQVRMKGKLPGDMAEVWFTDVLRRYPFPEFPGERFYSEAGVWLRMSGPYQMVFVSQAIYLCEYLADGLTKNRRKSQAASPRGVLDCSAQMMKPQCGVRTNLRGGLRYCVFARRLGLPFGKAVRESGSAFVAVLCWVPSLLLDKQWA